MDAALAGLIGAGIGAFAGIVGTFVTNYLQASQEHKKWIRDKRVESYSNSIRYLLRVINKRSQISIEGGRLITIMGKDVQKEWFDDLNEAVAWLSSLSIYCSKEQSKDVNLAFRKIENIVLSIINPNSDVSDLSGGDASSALDIIVSCARKDIGREVR